MPDPESWKAQDNTSNLPDISQILNGYLGLTAKWLVKCQLSETESNMREE